MSTDLKDMISEERIKELEIAAFWNKMTQEAYDKKYKGEPITIAFDFQEENEEPVEVEFDNKLDAMKSVIQQFGILKEEDAIDLLYTLLEGLKDDIKSR